MNAALDSTHDAASRPKQPRGTDRAAQSQWTKRERDSLALDALALDAERGLARRSRGSEGDANPARHAAAANRAVDVDRLIDDF
jgi:hypothetical protein